MNHPHGLCAPGCLGWFACLEDDGVFRIERCDECCHAGERLDVDDEDAEVVAAQWVTQQPPPQAPYSLGAVVDALLNTDSGTAALFAAMEEAR